jgi:NADP-dependent 3-hydroxy acid dehydrogenase YdfG
MEQMIDVNIKGVLYGIAAALPHMKQQKAGHIINVSSVAGHKVWPGGAGVCRDQVRCAGSFRRAAPRSKAL